MVITDLKNEFHPVPKQARIKNKKLLKDKKGICQICGKKTSTEKHHKKQKVLVEMILKKI